MTTQVAARHRVEFKSQFSILKCCLTDLCFSHCCHFSECDSVQPKSSCYFGHRTQMYIISSQPNDYFLLVAYCFLLLFVYNLCKQRALDSKKRTTTRGGHFPAKVALVRTRALLRIAKISFSQLSSSQSGGGGGWGGVGWGAIEAQIHTCVFLFRPEKEVKTASQDQKLLHSANQNN